MDEESKGLSLLIIVVRSVLFGLLYCGVYALMLYVSLPIDDGFGIVRGFLVAVVARLAESLFYKIILK